MVVNTQKCIYIYIYFVGYLEYFVFFCSVLAFAGLIILSLVLFCRSVRVCVFVFFSVWGERGGGGGGSTIRKINVFSTCHRFIFLVSIIVFIFLGFRCFMRKKKVWVLVHRENYRAIVLCRKPIFLTVLMYRYMAVAVESRRVLCPRATLAVFRCSFCRLFWG